MRPPKVLKMLTILTAFCLLMGMAASASADLITTPGIYVNGTEALSLNNILVGQTYTAQGVEVTLKSLNLDPGIIWSVNATNTTAGPENIQVSFGPFATPGYPTPITVSSSVGGTLTDGNGLSGSSTGSVSIAPYLADYISINYTYNAIGLVNAWGVGPAFYASLGHGLPYKGATIDYPVDYIYNQTLVPLGPGSNDNFFEEVSFTLGYNDSTGLSGNCSFVPIPIPPTALLLGSGLLGLGLAGWRRKRQS